MEGTWFLPHLGSPSCRRTYSSGTVTARRPVTCSLSGPAHQTRWEGEIKPAGAERAYWESTLPAQVRKRALNKLFPVAFTDPENGPELLNKSKHLHPFGILTRKGLQQSEALGAALRAAVY